MNRLLSIIALLTLIAAAAWAWALRQGPGMLEFPPLPPWPKTLAAVPTPPEGIALVGTLLHADGTPAPDALIQVTLPATVRWAWTNEKGKFTLPRLPADQEQRTKLEFIALALEHMPAIFTTDQAVGGPIVWSLPPPIPELEVLPELHFADFEGRVDRGVLNTEGLEVWLIPPPGVDPLTGQIERRAVVDKDGFYQLPSLTTGVYQAHILPPWARGGTWPILGTGALSFDPDSSQPIPRLATLEGSLSGHVSSASGAPLVGALLLASDPADKNHLWPPAQSDESGNFQVKDLPPGPLRLELITGKTRQVLELVIPASGEATVRFDLAD